MVGEGDEGAGGVKGGGRRSAAVLQSCQWPVTRSLSALLGGTHYLWPARPTSCRAPEV